MLSHPSIGHTVTVQKRTFNVSRRQREVLYADMSAFDYLPHTTLTGERTYSPLLAKVREIVEALDPLLQNIWYMRYVDRMSIRKIARELGYSSHWVIQVYLEQINERVQEALKDTFGEPGLPVRSDNDTRQDNA